MDSEVYPESQAYSDERKSLRLKQMASIAEAAGYSSPSRVAENAETLRSAPVDVLRYSHHFEPPRHDEGLRYALWTLNTYELSINEQSGIYESQEPTRRDWEISKQERGLVRIALGEWRKAGDSSMLPELNDDLVAMYAQELRKVSLLTAEEEVELAKQIEAGLYACHKLEGGKAHQGRELTNEEKKDYIELALVGKDALDHFYLANLPLVVYVAKKFTSTSMPLSDMIQEGNLGLRHAIEKFDYKKGYKFSTYATKWIKQAITHTLPEQTDGAIPFTEHIGNSLRKLRGAWDEYVSENDRNPGIDTLVTMTGLPRIVVEGLYVHIEEPLSLNHGIVSGKVSSSTDKRPIELIDTITESERYAPYSVTVRNDTYRRIWRALDALTDTERKTVIARFGLDGQTAMTIGQVGGMLGLGRNAVAKRIDRILEKLQENPNLQNL